MDAPVVEPNQNQNDLGTLNYAPQKPEVTPPIPETPKPVEAAPIPEAIQTITPTLEEQVHPAAQPETPPQDKTTTTSIVNQTTQDQPTSSLQTSSDSLTREADDTETRFIEEVGAAHGSE